jgi:hypothetical protein
MAKTLRTGNILAFALLFGGGGILFALVALALPQCWAYCMRSQAGLVVISVVLCLVGELIAEMRENEMAQNWSFAHRMLFCAVWLLLLVIITLSVSVFVFHSKPLTGFTVALVLAVFMSLYFFYLDVTQD